jgi:hypothetical protein
MWFYKARKDNNSMYYVVYFSRPLDWVLGFFALTAFIILIVSIEPYIPDFLKIGVFSLLNKDGVNANVAILNNSSSISPIITIFICLFLVLFFPKAAYSEEKTFRHGIINLKDSIWSNIKFGLIHCILGVPIWIGLCLSLMGFILTMRYIYEYQKTNSYDMALCASTSLHGKYNIIALTIFILTLLN